MKGDRDQYASKLKCIPDSSRTMMISIDTLQTLDREAWDARLLSAPEATIRQTASWGASAEALLRMEPKFLTVRDETGEVLAQLLVLRQVAHHRFFRKRPARSLLLGLAKPWFQELHWLDGLVVFDKGRAALIFEAVVDFLEDYSRRWGIVAQRGVRLPVYWQDAEALAQADDMLRGRGYERRDWATFVIDLRPTIEEIWRSFKSNVRKNIRKCEKQGVTIHKDSTGERLAEYQAILEEDRRHIGKRPFSIQHKLMRRKYLRGPHLDWQLYYAVYEGRMVGGMTTLTFNGNAIHAGFCRSDFCREQNLAVYYGLMWEFIQDAKKRGYVRYDLAGVAPSPRTAKERGIYAFKEKWGGRLIPYAEYTKVFRPGTERVIRFFRDGLRRLGVR